MSQFAAMMDFTSQSFGTGDTLDELTVGELSLCVEMGPQALLVGLMRGSRATALVRQRLSDALAMIHAEFGHALTDFRGDLSPFVSAARLLRPYLGHGPASLH